VFAAGVCCPADLALQYGKHRTHLADFSDICGAFAPLLQCELKKIEMYFEHLNTVSFNIYFIYLQNV
jgi:hypothetical protein